MRYIVFGILVFALMFYGGGVLAQERGIGVSPAKIEIGQNAEWPYTIPITVTNFSSEAENFEVTFEKNVDTIVSAAPGRFSLDAGGSARVLVTFEEPRRLAEAELSSAEGFVEILSMRTSPEGFTTGTGLKIPFRIEAQNDSTKFLAGAGEAFSHFGWFPKVLGMLVIFMALWALWHVSDYGRRYLKI